ncbi:hypothetical protein [Roseicitreum antarcticum]|jgi:hypothetical protein|uniref:Uncharacterized protein n=1 Tax=Roseicitreum antarcticum TaxID=564137 RepID=A0A1H3EE10_9RHOB|nr:hypothetical protein [Roseicitreum antarcticum]SDX76963.1 hypothetical protein SAMN04488238_12026 [Roseicitreum antarcticum]
MTTIKESALNNQQVFDFIHKRPEFIGLKVQDLVLSQQKPCNFEP